MPVTPASANVRREPQSGSALARPSYDREHRSLLGIEVDDAIELAEKIDI